MGIPPVRCTLDMVGLRAVFRTRRPQILLGSPFRSPGALVLGEPCEPPFEPALQPVHRAAADLDRFPDAEFRLRAAAGPARLSPGDDRDLRRVQPDLPVLDPYRSDRPDAALVRGGDEHAQPPPRPPCHQPALSGSQLCRGLYRVGQAVRHLRTRSQGREDPLWHRQAAGQLQPAVVGVPRVGRHRAGYVARAVEAQTVLPPARTRLDA